MIVFVFFLLRRIAQHVADEYTIILVDQSIYFLVHLVLLFELIVIEPSRRPSLLVEVLSLLSSILYTVSSFARSKELKFNFDVSHGAGNEIDKETI